MSMLLIDGQSIFLILLMEVIRFLPSFILWVPRKRVYSFGKESREMASTERILLSRIYKLMSSGKLTSFIWARMLGLY